MTAIRTGVALALVCLFAGAATADEAPAGQKGAQCVCVEAENGAREGETLEQRAVRLERAWRLTRAEKWVRAVNARRK